MSSDAVINISSILFSRRSRGYYGQLGFRRPTRDCYPELPFSAPGHGYYGEVGLILSQFNGSPCCSGKIHHWGREFSFDLFLAVGEPGPDEGGEVHAAVPAGVEPGMDRGFGE